MATQSGSASSPLGLNPLPVSARQETQIRELFYKRVRNKCAKEIKDFAACAHGRTFTSSMACRSQRLAMNKCMVVYDTQEEKDAAREEWFATIEKRAAERIEKEKKRQEGLALRRQYYGLSEEKGGETESIQ